MICIIYVNMILRVMYLSKQSAGSDLKVTMEPYTGNHLNIQINLDPFIQSNQYLSRNKSFLGFHMNFSHYNENV